jgi:hypothetical protein
MDTNRGTAFGRQLPESSTDAKAKDRPEPVLCRWGVDRIASILIAWGRSRLLYHPGS